MQIDKRRVPLQYQNKVNNAQGHAFEDLIKRGCTTYLMQDRAIIDKTPEPFCVMEKSRDGIFKGRFTARTQPDFQGTLAGGRSIVFEAKYTTTDKMRRDVLTDAQKFALEQHHNAGALAAVCVGIRDKFYFVPWLVWRDMEQLFKRKYMTAKSLEPMRVRFNGAILFLDYVHHVGGRWLSGADCDMEKWRIKDNGEAKAAQAETDGTGHAANGIQP